MKKFFFIFFAILIFNITAYADDSLIQIKQHLERIEKDIIDLQKTVFKKKNNLSSNNNDSQNTNSKITVFDMRLRDIENELQAINLNYENIFFEIEDLQNDLEELTLEFNNAIIKLNNEIIITNKRIIEKSDISDENTNTLEVEESNDVEQVKTEQKNTLGTLKISSNDISESNNEDKTEEIISYSSPEEQFQAAFDNLRDQKLEKGKNDLKLFINDHPSHILSGSAHYWLGEIYLLQKEYREAALIFAEGYQKYPDSVKSPDSLYKLAETLMKIEKKDEACHTLKQFVLKYSNNKLIDKTKSKIDNLQCS